MLARPGKLPVSPPQRKKYRLTCRNLPIYLTREARAMAAKTKMTLTSLEALGRLSEDAGTSSPPAKDTAYALWPYPDGESAEACELPSPIASERLRLMQRCGFCSPTRQAVLCTTRSPSHIWAASCPGLNRASVSKLFRSFLRYVSYRSDASTCIGR